MGRGKNSLLRKYTLLKPERRWLKTAQIIVHVSYILQKGQIKFEGKIV